MNWAEIFDWVQTGVVFAALTLFLWICLPNLLHAVGLDFFRNGILGGPSDTTPEGKSEDYAAIHRQLMEVTFEPVGMYWEQVVLGRLHKECIFTNRQEKCLAVVYWLAGGAPRCSFLTVFTNGDAAFTASYSRPEEVSARAAT